MPVGLVPYRFRKGRRGLRGKTRKFAFIAGMAEVHPRPYVVTTLQDDANAAGLVDLVGREFVPTS